MGRILKVVALTIGLTAFAILAIVGFAIWVFIPLMPAALVCGIAVYSARHRTALPSASSQEEERRKAA